MNLKIELLKPLMSGGNLASLRLEQHQNVHGRADGDQADDRGDNRQDTVHRAECRNDGGDGCWRSARGRRGGSGTRGSGRCGSGRTGCGWDMGRCGRAQRGRGRGRRRASRSARRQRRQFDGRRCRRLGRQIDPDGFFFGLHFARFFFGRNSTARDIWNVLGHTLLTETRFDPPTCQTLIPRGPGLSGSVGVV